MPYRVIVSGRAWSRTMITTLDGRSGPACTDGASSATARSETANASSTFLERDTGQPLSHSFDRSFLPDISTPSQMGERPPRRQDGSSAPLASVVQMDTFSIGGDLEVHRIGFGAMRITGDG